MTTDAGVLKRKFSAKQRTLNKPGVVLCGSIEQLRALAQLNDEIGALYPSLDNALSYIPERRVERDDDGQSRNKLFCNKVWRPLRDHCRRALEQTRKS